MKATMEIEQALEHHYKMHKNQNSLLKIIREQEYIDADEDSSM